MTLQNIYGIEPVDDMPHEPEAIPMWSETYGWTAYDPERRVGIYIHQGTSFFDPRLWRNVFVCLLPDGHLFMSKEYGRRPGERSTGSPVLNATCETPLERWTVRFDGAGRKVTRAEDRAGLIRDGLPVPARMELTYEGSAPVWEYGAAMKTQKWGHFHHEQPCRVSGTVAVAGEDFAFSGTGYRDHSKGPRDLTGFEGDHWLHAEFPSGRAFCAVEIFHEDPARHLRRGFVYDGATYHDVEVVSLPLLGDCAADPAAVLLELETPSGPAKITGEIQTAMQLTHKAPTEFCLGTDVDSPDDLTIIETMTRYTWDGEVGYGLCEWVTPMRNLAETPLERW